MKKILFAICALALVFTMSGMANAAYPEKPVQAVVAFAPGGTADITVRMLAKYLEKELGQPLVVVNKGGGGGIPGFDYVLNSKPDGYTIAAGAPTAAFSGAFFLKSKEYNMDDMEYVGGYCFLDRILLAKKDKPYQTWEEFVEYVKKNPGKVSVGSGASQEAMEVLRAAGIKDGMDMNLTLYKSGGEASADLLGGHIDACELGVGTAGYQAARNGELNVLANLGVGEIPGFPDTPKLKDLGYPFYTTLIYGFVLPKGTPEEIRAKWESALQKVLQDPEYMAAMEKMGLKPQFLPGTEYKKLSIEALKNLPAMVEYNKQAAK